MRPSAGYRACGMWLACGALLAGLLPGCGEDPAKSTGGAAAGKQAAGKQAAGATKRIILLTNDTSPFWDAVRAGVTDAEKDLKAKGLNYRAILEVNDGTPQGQIDKLRQFGSQSDIVGVGISALDADNVAVADEMRNLQRKGIKVVTVDSDVSRETLRDARFAFIGTENFLAGKELGVCAKNLRPVGGGSVTFVGRKGAQNARERIGGFTEGAGEKFQLIDTMEDSVKLDVARENVRNALRNHADKLTTLVGIWSYNAPAIVDVLKETGTRKKFTVVTFDAEPGAIVAMNDGMIDAMVVQNPYQMGYQGVRMLRALVEDDQATIKEMLPQQGKPDGDTYDTGIKVVVPNASSPLTPDMFGKKTEFLKLDEFRNWLAKYKLEGS